MIEQLRQRLQALQKTADIDGAPGVLALGITEIDAALGGGLARGALHEIAAPSEAHLAAATGFVLGLAAVSPSPYRNLHAGRDEKNILWIAEDMARNESGAPYGPGLDHFNLAPERLLTVCAARARDVLWAMEEALRCHAIGAVIGELRQGALDTVAVRRLSLAAAESGALALLLRAKPSVDGSTAATRWIVGAAPSAPATADETNPRFAAHLMRNRRGPRGSWMIEWSNTDEHFVLAAPALPLAAPAFDRPDRKVA